MIFYSYKLVWMLNSMFCFKNVCKELGYQITIYITTIHVHKCKCIEGIMHKEILFILVQPPIT